MSQHVVNTNPHTNILKNNVLGLWKDLGTTVQAGPAHQSVPARTTGSACYSEHNADKWCSSASPPGRSPASRKASPFGTETPLLRYTHPEIATAALPAKQHPNSSQNLTKQTNYQRDYSQGLPFKYVYLNTLSTIVLVKIHINKTCRVILTN